MSLAPPPPIRHRASSTATTPLTITTTTSSENRPNNQVISHSMLFIFASRILNLFHIQQKQHFSAWSPSTDSFILPLSSPSTPSSISQQFPEKPPAKFCQPSWPSVHAPILLVLILFPLSTALVLLSLSTLPISLSWPRTLIDLAHLGGELHAYSQSGPWPMTHVIGVMSITAIWMHAWSIPGSVIWNVLAGALFSPALATLLLTTLTTIGSVCATVLSKPLAPFLTHLFPRAVDMTRNAIEGGSQAKPSIAPQQPRSSAWVRLSILRLIGVVPWSGINIASGICGVAIIDCILGAFIGSLPWTAVTCQIGDILQTVASAPSPTPQTVSSLLTSPEILVKLAFLSFLSLAPILGRERLRALITHSPSPSIDVPSAHVDDERVSRWAWVQDWRASIRMPSHSRSREDQMRQLDVLVSEKDGIPS